ncbi:hypothetical protein AVEN_104804-1 [Araneus ventricosus]|uniref:Uncharacterized protein n=1 Tax=Araneus ventricosus TaxID=182803 RepID=A0A4Y2VH30_ARAVE|nr:hypothetical protein AVEN_104804-1 [Araneus ventricosus]
MKYAPIRPAIKHEPVVSPSSLPNGSHGPNVSSSLCSLRLWQQRDRNWRERSKTGAEVFPLCMIYRSTGFSIYDHKEKGSSPTQVLSATSKFVFCGLSAVLKNYDVLEKGMGGSKICIHA